MQFPRALIYPETILHTWRWAVFKTTSTTNPLSDAGKQRFYSAADAEMDAALHNNSDLANIILFRECYVIPHASRLLLYVYAHLVDREIRLLTLYDCFACRESLGEGTTHLFPPTSLSQGVDSGCGMDPLTARYRYIHQAILAVNNSKLKDFYMQLRKRLNLPYSHDFEFGFLRYIQIKYSVEDIPLPVHIPARIRELLYHMCPY